MKKRISFTFIWVLFLFLFGCETPKVKSPAINVTEKKIVPKDQLWDYLYEEKEREETFAYLSGTYYGEIKNATLFTREGKYKGKDRKGTFYFIRYVSPEGNEMCFSFDGPINGRCWEETIHLSTLEYIFYTSQNYTYKELSYLYAWSSPLESMKGAMKYNDKDAIVSANTNTIYKDGNYYEFYDEETYGKAIFKINRPGGGNFEGYAVYIDDYTSMITYQFNFIRESSEYDEEEAFRLANSIKVYNITISEDDISQ